MRFFVLIFALSLVLSTPAQAGELETVVVADVETGSSGTVSDEMVSSEAEVVSEAEVRPRNLPVFADWRERLSLFFTFNPVKKIEKQIEFAEARLGQALKAVESADSDESRARAENALKKAEDYIAKIESVGSDRQDISEEQKESLSKKAGEILLKRERVLGMIEDKITPEAAVRFEERREVAEAQTRRLLNAIENSNLPEKARAHLEIVKTRIEAEAEVRRAFQAERQFLVERIKNGEEVAEAEFEALRQETKMELERAREEFRSSKETVIRQVEKVKEEIRENFERPAEGIVPELPAVRARVDAVREEAREKKREEERVENRVEKREKLEERIEDRVEARVEQKVEKKIEQRVESRIEARDEKTDERIKVKVENRVEVKKDDDSLKRDDSSSRPAPAVRVIRDAKEVRETVGSRSREIEKEMSY